MQCQPQIGTTVGTPCKVAEVLLEVASHSTSVVLLPSLATTKKSVIFHTVIGI